MPLGLAVSGADFDHPGILHSSAELDFIKTEVQEGKEPHKTRWDQFTAKYNLGDEWFATDLVEMTTTGDFSDTLDLPGDKTYQWRAVVKHPRVKMTGDHGKVSVRRFRD